MWMSALGRCSSLGLRKQATHLPTRLHAARDAQTKHMLSKKKNMRLHAIMQPMVRLQTKSWDLEKARLQSAIYTAVGSAPPLAVHKQDMATHVRQILAPQTLGKLHHCKCCSLQTQAFKLSLSA